MEVYIEYAVIDNFIIDFLLLKTALTFTKIKVNRLRLVLSSVLGAGFSLLFPLIKLPVVLLTILKILSGLLIVTLSAKFNSVKSFYLTAILFISFTFLTGGAIMGLSNIFNVNLNNDIILSLMIIPVIVVVKISKAVFNFFRIKTVTDELNYSVSVEKNGIKVDARAFLDTGNNLTLFDKPLVVISKSLAKKLLKKTDYLTLKRTEVYTVNGAEEKFYFYIDKLIIYFRDGQNIYNNVIVAVSEDFSCEYEMILNPLLKIKENSKNEKDFDEIKKIS